MLEQVGQCCKCRTSIVCRDGFLDGIVLEDQRLICFPCSEAGGLDSDEDEGLGRAER